MVSEVFVPCSADQSDKGLQEGSAENRPLQDITFPNGFEVSAVSLTNLFLGIHLDIGYHTTIAFSLLLMNVCSMSSCINETFYL